MGLISFVKPDSGLEQQRPRLYRLAFAWCHDAALADDLVQETLSKALARRAQLREEAALVGWLVAILNNCWRDHLRRAGNFEDIDELHASLPNPDVSPEEACSRGQLIECVRAAVARLPLGQRQVLTLVDLEEMSYAEVAQTLNIPVGTVMSRLSRARAALKACLARAQSNQAAAVLRRVK
ncbi:MAG: RNA polymerase sigma factor [Thiotrichales bacterium]